MASPTDILTGASETTLVTATDSIIDLSVDVVYSTFNFILEQLTTNAGLVAFVVIILVLWGVMKRYKRKVM